MEYDYRKNDKELTDREISLWLGNMNFFKPQNIMPWRRRSLLKFFKVKNFDEISDDDKIKYSIKKLGDVTQDKDEFIHRKDWAYMNDLIGESEPVLHHPVFKIANEYICEHFNQKSENLLICSCSSRKPYSKSINYRKYLKIDNLDTIVMSNSGVIPINEGNDFSVKYPFRYYNWDHMKEFGKLKDDEEDFMYECAVNFLNKTNYKKVAFIAKPKHMYDNYFKVYERLKNEFKNIEFKYIVDDDVWNHLLKTFKKDGLTGLRMFQSNYILQKLLDFIK